jgi:hypothetical protein
MVSILFLPFIAFENFISSIASGFNLPQPPQIFSQLAQGQSQGLLPPAPYEFIKGSAISNIEEEEVVRDERGFVVKRIIRRKVEET